MSSVKIDGSKIKTLREQQGLTQLYLATVVGVTTDTISRWENKHYSSIKRDNAEKLAEALDITLEELLEEREQEPGAIPEKEHKKEQSSRPGTRSAKAQTFSPSAKLSLALLAGLMLTATLVLLLRQEDTAITCTRIVPEHSAPNVAFPVVIRIEANSEQELPILIREELVGDGRAWGLGPAGERKDFGRTPRWIGALRGGQARFTYQVTPTDQSKEGASIVFSGEIMTRKGQKTGSKVEGASSVRIAPYHWADGDRDYRISDNEILIAYETYSSPGTSTFDFSVLERLWLAGQYAWNGKAASFETAAAPLPEE